MNSDFIKALNQIEADKGINKDIIIEAVEHALVNAYKKNFGATNNVRVIIDKTKGDIRVFTSKLVVNKREIDLLDGEISVEGAQEIDERYTEGDIVEEEVTPKNFGRVAAQTARQMVVQKIKEASRDIVYEEFSLLKSEILSGEIVRKVGNTSRPNVLISLSTRSQKGQLLEFEALLPAQEQIPNETYNLNDRKTVYISDVKIVQKTGVPEIVVSRAHTGLVKRLFEREVPEIKEGIVRIESISREAGSRTKVSVSSLDENVEALGSCIGEKQQRINLIIKELCGEKIDIIEYSEDPAEYIRNALSPAKITSVEIIEEDGVKSALVIAPSDQLSLAIGKEGQNARLAARLTGWKIDIKSTADVE